MPSWLPDKISFELKAVFEWKELICGLGLLFEAEVEFKYYISVKKENKKGINMKNLFLEMNKI